MFGREGFEFVAGARHQFFPVSEFDQAQHACGFVPGIFVGAELRPCPPRSEKPDGRAHAGSDMGRRGRSRQDQIECGAQRGRRDLLGDVRSGDRIRLAHGRKHKKIIALQQSKCGAEQGGAGKRVEE